MKEAPNLSPSVIGRLKEAWTHDHDRWRRRDLSARRYVYIWADGVYLQARMQDAAACMLVVIGATPEGRKELVGFQVGVRESTQSWRELLVDLKARGLSVAPRIAVGDGALGFWKALEELFPSTRHPTLLATQGPQRAQQGAQIRAAEHEGRSQGDPRRA
jgi:transposase-like protein